MQPHSAHATLIASWSVSPTAGTPKRLLRGSAGSVTGGRLLAGAHPCAEQSDDAEDEGGDTVFGVVVTAARLMAREERRQLAGGLAQVEHADDEQRDSEDDQKRGDNRGCVAVGSSTGHDGSPFVVASYESLISRVGCCASQPVVRRRRDQAKRIRQIAPAARQ